MLANRLRSVSGGEYGIYCPIGAEGYDADGNLVIPLASEGWVRSPSGMVVFKTAQNFGNVSIVPGDYEVLLLAGGGAGAGSGGSGGGAGGLRYFSSYTVAGRSVPVVVGDGGQLVAYSTINADNGDNSTFDEEAAAGGGGAGFSANSSSVTSGDGQDGGSGGGAGVQNGSAGRGDAGSGNVPATDPAQGYDGSRPLTKTSPAGGGGAGGAASSSTGGVGLEYFGYVYGRGGRATGNSGVTDNSGYGGNMDTKGSSGNVIVRWGGYSHNYDPTA